MSNESKALELASIYDGPYGTTTDHKVAAELRRQHAEIESLRAQLEARVPDGWKLVPVEPTEEMCSVDFECDDSIGVDSARICYKAMLSAAPSQQAPVQGEPAEHQYQGTDGRWYSFIDQRHYDNTVADGRWPIRALYTTPQQASEPMTDREVMRCFNEEGYGTSYEEFCRGVRFAERFHKIGEKQC
jgi:hypothetical protein